MTLANEENFRETWKCSDLSTSLCCGSDIAPFNTLIFLAMSKQSFSVPLVVLLGLQSGFCLTPIDDDSDESRPVYRTVGRSVLDTVHIVVQDVFTGDLLLLDQTTDVFPPSPSKVRD
ncbi:MAG: hypothetical protein [Microvirus sp.]|nr:MAG: hypothetical protein [Microvirus sp.]